MKQAQPVPSGEATIAAFATAVGGPVAIIRISGNGALDTAGAVWRGKEPLDRARPRQLHLGTLVSSTGEVDNKAMAVYMPAPASYTGEDMVEIHCHGGVLGARLALLAVLRHGARHAEPGEFTRRAFVNGKMDLTQAEAVADVINAHTEAALHLANRQLQGVLSREVKALYADLSYLLTEVEVRLDFPEEDLDWLSPAELNTQLGDAAESISRLLASRNEVEVLREGIVRVIVGAPNVGKSSLLNAILGRERAIVTHLPGTTRDTLEELAHIRTIPVRLIDTAGIRNAKDVIEQTGIERSYASMAGAHIVLWVIDASKPYSDQEWENTGSAAETILVANKSDIAPTLPTDTPAALRGPVATCALTGKGLDTLFDSIEEAVWSRPHPAEPEVAVSARHAVQLETALAEVRDAKNRAVDGEWELVAASLRNATEAVGRITGETAAPDVLDMIFSRFCIGK